MATILPRAHEALVERRKLEDYILSPQHERGRHKARTFRVLLGIERGDWAYLRTRLLDGLVDAVEAVIEFRDFGYLANVPIEVEGLNGAREMVISKWEVRTDTPPRLVTAYIKQRRP